MRLIATIEDSRVIHQILGSVETVHAEAKRALYGFGSLPGDRQAPSLR